MKRNGNQSQTSCVQPISASSVAPKSAQKSAVRAAPKRRTSEGITGADRMKPSGVIAADRPIRLGDAPCSSRMKLSSGYVRPCAIANTETVAITPASAGHGVLSATSKYDLPQTPRKLPHLSRNWAPVSGQRHAIDQAPMAYRANPFHAI